MMTEQEKIAFEIAKTAHQGQVDKNGDDYINHPLTVSKNAQGDYKVKTAALLHDVLEDSLFEAEDLLNAGIEKDIVDAVVMLTHPEGVEYLDYVRMIKENEIARAVKMADLTHNMDLSRIENPTDKDYERLQKYKKAYAILTDAE